MGLPRFPALVTAVLLAAALIGSRDAVADETTYRVAGLTKRAEIVVDSDGVPHIYAGEHYDAFFVQGFNAARDRLWQIDLYRKRGLGLLSKDLGPAYVEQDRANRLLNYRGPMRREWLAYGADARRISQAFTAGINAYVDLALANDELLPWEFKFLNYEPDHWRPQDVVRLRTHGLVGNLTDEVARAYFMRDHGLGYERLRLPLQPDWDIIVPEGLDLGVLPADQGDLLRVYELAVSGVTFDPEDLRGLSFGKTTVGGREVAPARASSRRARASAAGNVGGYDVQGSNN